MKERKKINEPCQVLFHMSASNTTVQLPFLWSQTGQFYVISDVLTTTAPRNLAPRASETVMNPRLTGSSREEKRRVTHNEVERRRRDKINTWIYRLAKIIPDCPEAHTKNSQVREDVVYPLTFMHCVSFYLFIHFLQDKHFKSKERKRCTNHCSKMMS